MCIVCIHESLDVGEKIEEGAKWVGEKIEEGAKAIGEGIETAVEAVGDVGEAVVEGVVDTVKDGIDTVAGGFNAIDKLLDGDKSGALKAITETPLYRSGEELVESVKQVGEGIYQGDLGKIGNGALGILTNDFTSLIPGGKAIGTVGKIAKKSAKELLKKGFKKEAKQGLKMEVKHMKNDIAENTFKKKRKTKRDQPDKKKKKKDKKDKRDKTDGKNDNDEEQKQCPVKEKKGKRMKRAVVRPPKTGRKTTKPAKGKKGKKNSSKTKKQNQCNDPDKCGIPEIREGSIGKYFKDTVEDCRNTAAGKFCHYLCHPGYDEQPQALICKDHGHNDKRWDHHVECEPHSCEQTLSGTFIKVKAPRWGSDIYITNKRGPDALLYAVLFDESKKLPIYSVAFHNFPVHVKIAARAESFRQHPCSRLGQNQAKNADYENLKNKPKKNPHGNS